MTSIPHEIKNEKIPMKTQNMNMECEVICYRTNSTCTVHDFINDCHFPFPVP